MHSKEIRYLNGKYNMMMDSMSGNSYKSDLGSFLKHKEAMANLTNKYERFIKKLNETHNATVLGLKN